MFFGALVIGFGESAQRAEDKKTISAIYVDNEPNTPDSILLDAITDVSNKRGK